MPNICHNRLTVRGPKRELDRFLKAARGTDPDRTKLPFSLKSLFPIPAHLDTDRPVTNTEEESWYTWCCQNWGTKWDVFDVTEAERRAEEFHVAFDTAWAPPLEAFTRRIAPNFPALTFHLCFDEPNMELLGECAWSGGKPER